MTFQILTLGLLASAAVASATAQAPYSRAGVDKAGMAKLAKEQKAAELAFQKSPKDAKKKQAYVNATNRHGLACMTTDAIDRKLKYRMALTDFRKVLKAEPKNKIARDNYDLIVSIYKSMGRPVPG